MCNNPARAGPEYSRENKANTMSTDALVACKYLTIISHDTELVTSSLRLNLSLEWHFNFEGRHEIHDRFMVSQKNLGYKWFSRLDH